MYSKTFLLIAAGIILLACNTKEDSKSKSYEKINTPSGSWELVWNDEFDYEGLPDSTKWSYDIEGNSWGWGNNEA